MMCDGTCFMRGGTGSVQKHVCDAYMNAYYVQR